VDAFIAFPKKGEGPFPVMMFAHSSGGAELFTNEWFKFNRLMAKALLKKGVAAMFLNPQPIKETKTWMVLGGADDFTRADRCVDLGKKYKTNGADIEVTVKKGLHHGFTANYEAEYEADNQIFSKCPGSFMTDEGNITFIGNAPYPECITMGAHIGGNKGGVFRKPFLKFFKENLL